MSILTAVTNDYGYARVFSRQVEAVGRPGDVTIALSTSGGVGMFLQEQAEHPRLRFDEAAVIGDSLSDMEPGNCLGMRTLLIDRGTGEPRRARQRGIRVDHVVSSLSDAVARLLD